MSEDTITGHRHPYHYERMKKWTGYSKTRNLGSEIYIINGICRHSEFCLCNHKHWSLLAVCIINKSYDNNITMWQRVKRVQRHTHVFNCVKEKHFWLLVLSPRCPSKRRQFVHIWFYPIAWEHGVYITWKWKLGSTTDFQHSQTSITQKFHSLPSITVYSICTGGCRNIWTDETIVSHYIR